MSGAAARRPVPLDVGAEVAALRARLAAQGTALRAAGAARYLKSDLEFLGATVPAVRAAAKAWARARPALTRVELRRLGDALWASRVHELRSVAIALLEVRVDLLRAADAAWLIGLVEGADTWAHVDWLATKPIGALAAREPAVRARLPRWAVAENFWVRRTALLALHDPLLRGDGDFALFARLAAPMLAEREFFIRKAIGWVLRSTCKRTPALTVAFVERHAPRMSGLTFKEATRNLPPAVQLRLRRQRAAG